MPSPTHMTERALQREVIRLARACGFRVFHFRKAQLRDGRWLSPLGGEPGFPDLVLVGRGRVLFRELKQDGAHPDARQRTVLQALRDCGADVAIWRPRDLPRIAEDLSRSRVQVYVHPDPDQQAQRQQPVRVVPVRQ